MAKLSKEKSLMLADYVHYVQRHAHSEQALMQAISNKAPDETRKQIIKNAQWAAREAIHAAARIGLDRDFIQSDILQRAK